MPFKSKAQQRYMFANREKLEKEGVDVKEWADSTDFKELPERAKKACVASGIDECLLLGLGKIAAGMQSATHWDKDQLGREIGESMVDYKQVHRGRVTSQQFAKSWLDSHHDEIHPEHRALAQKWMHEELAHQAEVYKDMPRNPAGSARYLFGDSQ